MIDPPSHLAERKWLFLILIVFFSGDNAFGQTDHQKVFASVPKSHRTQLAERLKLLVEYERDRRWNDQYELLSPLAIQGETRTEYIERRQTSIRKGGYTILGFTPKYVSLIYDGRWEVFGCVKVRKDGQTQNLNGEVAGFLEQGQWYLSQIFFDIKRCSR
jgi:hypothetical protein